MEREGRSERGKIQKEVEIALKEGINVLSKDKAEEKRKGGMGSNVNPWAREVLWTEHVLKP